MYTIVIYLLDEKYRQELIDYFRLPQFDLYLTTDEHEVLDICGKELVDLILVWDAKIQAIRHLQGSLRKLKIENIPLIPVVKEAEDFHASIETGAFNAFQIPMPRKEFSKLLEQILNIERNTGSQQAGEIIDDLSEASNLINSLHRLSKNKESALITVTQSGHSGRIYIKEGKIVRAIFRILEGIDALNKLVGLYRAEMTVHLTEVIDEDQLEMEVPDVLVKLHQRLNEQLKYFGYHLTDSEILVAQKEINLENIQLNDMQRQILDLTAKGETAYNILTVLNQDNLEILKALQILLDKNVIVPERRQMTETPQKSPEKPHWKYLSFFRKLFFRKNKLVDSIPEKPALESELEMPLQPSINSAEIVVSQMDSEIRQKVKTYFARIANADS
jgi:hypothetical protein